MPRGKRKNFRPISPLEAIIEALERRTLLSAAHPLLQAAVRFTSADDAAFHTSLATTTFTVTTTGFSTGTLLESGSLPSGVTFDAAGNGTATLAGTPGAMTGGVYDLVLSAGTVTQAFTLTVDQPLAFSSAGGTTFAVGGTDTFGIVVTGFPYATVSEHGALPRGVIFKREGDGTAELAGAPAERTGGTYDLSLSASNGVATNVMQSYVLTVDQPAAITSAKQTRLIIGQPGTFTIQTSGPPAASTIVETATLPPGLTFTNNDDGTATLAGTPTPTVPGSYALTFTAFNGIGDPTTQAFTLVLDQPPAITSADALTLTADVPGAFTIAMSGYPLPTIQRVSLPHGLHLKNDGDGTATLYGTPAAESGGTYPISLTADNAVGAASQAFTLTVEQGPVFTNTNRVHFVSGVPYTFTFTTSGFPAAEMSEIGALPSGLTFTDLGNGTATIAGPLAEGTSGTYVLRLGAQNSVSSTTQTFTLTVN